MFGRKSTVENNGPEIIAHVMPGEFYDGANPVVKFKTNTKEVSAVSNSGLSRTEKILLDKSTVAGGGQKNHPANLFASPKFIFLTIGGLFVLTAIGGGGYYYWQYRRSVSSNTTPPAPVLEVATTVPTAPDNVAPSIEEPPTTTVEIAPTTTVPVFLPEAPLEFPSLLSGDSPDLDKDGVSDLAEQAFETDPSLADTDGDKYSDQTEISNLYNPAGFAPVKIIDSGLVKNYSSVAFGYGIYYPNTWAVGEVDSGGRDVLFSTLGGDNIEMRVFDLNSGQKFPNWFTMWAPREKFSDLALFDSAFKEKGLRRSDGLIYYFADQAHVYVLIYHSAGESINYRAVINMMARSFRLAGNTVPLPIPVMTDILPDIESATPTPAAIISTSTL